MIEHLPNATRHRNTLETPEEINAFIDNLRHELLSGNGGYAVTDVGHAFTERWNMEGPQLIQFPTGHVRVEIVMSRKL
jgi:hypothetical protein